MKRTTITICFLLACALSQALSTPTLSTYLFVTRATEVEPVITYPPIGQRTPSELIYCIIDLENGVELPSIPNEELNTFTICDADSGAQIVTFTREDDFVDYLFLNTGSYLVSFTTDDYIYSGYIEI